MLGGTAFGFDPVAARAALGFDDHARPPLICEEDLSGTLHIGLPAGYAAKAVAARIASVAPEARIVIFVRAQHKAALSWYAQYVREGGTGTAARYLFPETYRNVGKSRPFMVPRFDFSQLDYRGLIETYDSLFGRDRVHLFAYEMLARDRKATLARLCAELDLALDDQPLDTRRVNDSYRRALLPLARFANLFTYRSVPDKRTLIHLPYWYTVRKALLKQANRLPLGPRPHADRYFSHQTLDWIGQRFWESNRWLAARMNADLGALGYPIDPPAAPVPMPAPPAWRRWMRQ